ncbi:SGNH/GDSL hydrolase family protein [Humisphaera borealis]|uniref:SGNH/GDSL hydrolase family protein n=1 Tax=Humisphaera borealis TaxID=2807512 RepID=A0A7M2WRK9_9BACT|nr:SGNH/GDSL hydrolase family protein [Humisphaera borealis]QOV88185.1 SGNH/GDSL hydrolase family protein [Humisphaera borealis]
MNRRLFPLVALAVLAVSSLARSADFPLAKAVECKPRAGLPNFFAKAATDGASLKIAYFGGSITAQAGWRPKTLALFRDTYPKAKFEEINAAIGGTGSDLGVFRLQQDVLVHKPDLLFVEFAVNDGGAEPGQIFRCMEGIVRQTWKALPDCDICFVYTLVDGFVPTLQEGNFPRAASVMERVAEHYGIPSIHMGMEVARLVKDQKLIMKGTLPKTDEQKAAAGGKMVFSPDGVHPFPETGHELYLKAIIRSLPAIQKASGKPAKHELKAPLTADNYENAKMIPITKATLSEGVVALTPASNDIAKRFANRVSTLHKADQPGQTIAFKFKGTRAAIYDIIGPDCGQVTITIDDKPPVTRPRFDAYCTYHRLATLLIGTELADAVHTVKIEIHPDQPDKAKILSQRNEKIDKPERFDGRAFYPAAILLVGDLE